MGDDITKWRLEGVDVIEAMEHHLKGEFLETKTMQTKDGVIAYSEWTLRKEAAFMNDVGAKAVVTTATMIVNKVIFLSNVSEEDIYTTCKQINLSLARLIFDNWTEFDIVKRPDPIIHILMEFVFHALMRAKGGGERDALTKVESIMRSIKESPQGGHSMFPFGGKKNEQSQ